MDEDAALLREYVETRSDQVFGRLVARHIDLVYSAALRRMAGDPHRAAEVTQMVFIDFARKAPSLTRHPLLAGWLHQSTRWAAGNLRRAEQRRWTHEQAAAAELAVAGGPESGDWAAVRPLLDEALDELREADRVAVILRFFHQCSYAEVGSRLGTGEDAARVRVNRALGKLHGILRRKGLTSGAVALGLALTNHAVAAAPADLAAAVVPAATAAGATATGLVAGGGVAILMSKVTMAVIGAGVLTLAVLCLQQQQTLAAERAALARAQAQRAADAQGVAQLATKVERAQAELARLPAVADLPVSSPAELERKRLDLIIRKGELDDRYGALFRRLKLPAAELDTLKRLLVERAQAIYDANQLVKTEDLAYETPSESRMLEQAAAQATDAQIAMLLGQENFDLFTQYLRPQVADRLVNQWSQGRPDDPAEWEKGQKLADLWEQTNAAAEEAAYARNEGTVASPAYMAGAKELLTAEEYQALERAESATIAYNRMAEIARAAAYAGKLKLSKNSARDYAPAQTQTKTP